MADTEESTRATDERTEAVYQYVRGRLEQHDPPALRDIIKDRVGADTELGIITSTGVVRWHIEKLIEQGRLTWRRAPAGHRIPRGLRLPHSRLVVLNEHEWEVLEGIVLSARRRFPELALVLDGIYGELFGKRAGQNGDGNGEVSS